MSDLSTRGPDRPSESAGHAGPAVTKIGVMLARRVPDVPAAETLPGGCVYEPKFDGFRALLHRAGAPARDDGPRDEAVDGTVGGADASRPSGATARLWSRHGTDLGVSFPEVLEAATILPPGVLLDGELVLWRDGRLDFDELSRRASTTGARARARRGPAATFIAFDLLEAEGRDLRLLPWHERRAALEVVGGDWTGSLALSPTTRDADVARAWMRDMRRAGIEGVVVKAWSGEYRPGVRDWLKVKSYETREVIVGAVTGTLEAPETVLVGLRDAGGVLRLVGRSVPLSRVVSQAAAAHLRAAGGEHPWPEMMPSGRFGRGRGPVRVVRVEPVVAEVRADAAVNAGVFRHSVQLVRLRPDLPVDAVDPLPPPST